MLSAPRQLVHRFGRPLIAIATLSCILLMVWQEQASAEDGGRKNLSCNSELQKILAASPPEVTDEDLKLFKEYPSPFRGMPTAFFDLQNRYLGTAAYACCALATHKLLNDEDRTKLDLGIYWWHAALNGDKLKLFKNYQDACTIKIDDAMLPPAYRSKLEEFVMRTGIFVRSSDVTGKLPVCAGIRLDLYRVLTAKHCFHSWSAWKIERGRWSQAERTDAQIGAPIYIPHDMRFVEFADPSRPYKLTWADPKAGANALFYPFNDEKLKDDRIVVHLVDPGNEPLTPLNVRKPKQWDKLVFVTVSPTVKFRSIITNPDVLSDAKAGKKSIEEQSAVVRDAIRLDDSPNCYIFAISERCIFHSCQTLAGMSGSPLISVDRDQGVSIVGVHTGSNGQSDTFPCGFTRGKWVRNRGSFPIGH